MTKRGNHKPGAGFAPDSSTYVREIIKCLEKVNSLSGCHSYQIFEDWSQLVQVCLEALPAHLIALAQTGRFADDTAETRQVFERLQGRYQPPPYRSKSAEAWQYFSQAFALLLESAEPGLWGPASYGVFDCGYAGPDVIGQIFMEFTHPSSRTGQYLTPWPVVMLMSHVMEGGSAEVYARLKQACQHPDNILAHAVLLAGLAIEDPGQAREWFITRVVPAAMPHFEIIKMCDPAVGTGRMLLGLASQFEPWMVQMGLVQFMGQDIDFLMSRLATINCQLYGLNNYALKLAEAVSIAAEAWQTRPDSPALLPKSIGAAIDQVGVCRQQSGKPSPPPDELSFENLFRRMAQPVVVEEVPA